MPPWQVQAEKEKKYKIQFTILFHKRHYEDFRETGTILSSDQIELKKQTGNFGNTGCVAANISHI